MSKLLIIFVLLFNTALACGAPKKPRRHWVIRTAKVVYKVAKRVAIFIVLRRLSN